MKISNNIAAIKSYYDPGRGSLRDTYYILFRHKWKMALFFIMVVMSVTLLAVLTAETYRSEAKLMVRLGRENVSLDPTATTGQIISISQTRMNEINSEMEILRSQELAEKIVELIGPERILNPQDKEALDDGTIHKTIKKRAPRTVRAAVGWLSDFLGRLNYDSTIDDDSRAIINVMENLKISTLKDSAIINIAFNARSPGLAREVVTKLIGLYQEKHIAVYKTPGSYEFFSKQSEDLKKKLLQAESELRDIKNTIGVASPAEQRLIVMNRIGNLKQQRETNELNLAASKAKIQEMQKVVDIASKQEAAKDSVGFSNQGADMMRARLYDLQIDEQDLVTKFREDSQEVKTIRQQIAEAQALLNKQKANTVQTELLTEEILFSSFQAKAKELENQLKEAQVELKVVNDADFRISQLMREINVYETSYQKYSDSLEQARVDYALQAGNISNISVVQAATLPISPVGPRRSRYIIAGLLLGIFGSIGLAFICELMDHSLNTPEQVRENLQLSTLTSIPHTRLGHRNGDVPAKLWQSYSALGEQLLMNKNGSKKKARTIAITSCYPGEGVSTVAINISTWLAKHYNNNVLLIDANTLDPVVHHLFSTELSPGLVDILNGRCNGDSIIESSIDKLHVLSAGIEDINLSEVVKLAEFRKLLQALKKSYNYVVLDLPAVSQTNIVPLLSRMCDDAVMVVEAERSRCEVVQRIKEQFVKSQANIRGVILNKRRFYIPKWLYQTL